MQVSVQLMLVGIAIFWIGITVLLIGRNEKTTFTDIFGLGRRVYDNLYEYFNRTNVLVFKLFAYSGMLIVFIGIIRIFYELDG